MPFDPAKPANNSPNSSAEILGQLTSPNTDSQIRSTRTVLHNAADGRPSSSNGIGTLGLAVNDLSTQAEVQAISDTVDELINARPR